MNYKIFNWQGKQLLELKADYNMINENGQIIFYNNEQSWPVAVFPDGTLVVQQSALVDKREFNFPAQKEEAKLKERNEYLFAEKKKPISLSESMEDEDKRKGMKYNIEKRIPVGADYMNELHEIEAAKNTILSTGNDKLDENQEKRALNEIVDQTEEEKLAEKRRKNREYAKDYYKKQRERQGKPYTPKDDAEYIAGEVEVSDEDHKNINDGNWFEE